MAIWMPLTLILTLALLPRMIQEALPAATVITFWHIPWPNPEAFAMPAPGSYGNLGRNALHGPGLAQFDLTLHKRFFFSETKNLEFRTEVYNLFNRANFSNPPALLPSALGVGAGKLQPGEAFSSVSAGNFGQINSTVARTIGLGASRQIQLSLRFNF